MALKGRGGPFQRRRRSALASGGTMEELSKLINQYFGVNTSQVYRLTKDQPAADVPDNL